MWLWREEGKMIRRRHYNQILAEVLKHNEGGSWPQSRKNTP